MSSPSLAQRAASCTMLASGLATRRVSMTRISTSGKSNAAMLAERTVPLTSVEGWMHRIGSPSGARRSNLADKQLRRRGGSLGQLGGGFQPRQEGVLIDLDAFVERFLAKRDDLRDDRDIKLSGKFRGETGSCVGDNFDHDELNDED